MWISMADEAKPVSFDERLCASPSASALESAGLKAFVKYPGRGMTAARKFETFLREVGDVWHDARRTKALAKISMESNGQVCERNLQSLEETLTDTCASVFALDGSATS